MARRKYDVCIIGSGASGGSLASKLARKGVDVCLVEGGPRRPPHKLNSHAWPYERKPLGVPPVRVDANKEPYEVIGFVDVVNNADYSYFTEGAAPLVSQ